MVNEILAAEGLEVLAVELVHARVGLVELEQMNVGLSLFESSSKSLENLRKVGTKPAWLRAADWRCHKELKKIKTQT